MSQYDRVFGGWLDSLDDSPLSRRRHRMTKPPATRDDTNEFSDKIGEALATDNTLWLEAKEYVIRRPIVVPSSAGLEVLGENLYKTRLVWAGDDDVMFVRD